MPNSTRKATLSQAQLQNLSLEDLLSGVNPQALAKAASRPRAEAGSINILNRDARREQLIREAAERAKADRAALSPWVPEATVLAVLRTTCTHCQSEFLSPAADSLMVRFRHRRNGSTWETANHPCQRNPSLPRETKFLERQTHACPHCFLEPGVLSHYQQQQSGSAAEEPQQ